MASESKRRKLSDGNYKAVESHNGDAEQPPSAAEKKDQRTSLFVRSLPPSVTSDRLTEYFSQSYPLKHATVVLDPQTKTSRGFGFVTFADAKDAQAAAIELNNSVLDGRKIKVEIAESRNRDIPQQGGRSSLNTKAVELRAQREKQREETLPPRLIVRNLPWSIKTPEDLALLFRSYGKVKHSVVPSRGPRVQAGFGFVVLRGKKNAEKAILGVNGKEVDGRTLAVDWAVDKKTWEGLQEGQKDSNEPKTEDTTTKKQVPNGVVAQKEEINSAESAEEDENDASEVTGDGSTTDSDSGMALDTEKDPYLEIEEDSEEDNTEPDNTTIFIRNVPFTATDPALQAHFSPFGAIRYARVVMDPETERPKGTAFVCFFNAEDAKACVKGAPKHDASISSAPASSDKDKKRRGETLAHSILQNEASDPTGRYTMDGRILQVTRALSKTDAARRTEAASDQRDKRDHDKRRLFLLSEGTISRSSKLYEQLGKAELDIREASARQRQKLIKTNANLCLSLTRLSVRNIPRNIGSKELKALAREAVVGFATDVKEGVRQALSKEEISRGGEAMKEAERQRKKKGVGIVRQAKIVFEGREGGKVKEGPGAGRSRGYGFIEYVSHRNALMGLRWLNGRSVKGKDGERTKRLIVEFAIENAQVVQRRGEREERVRSERASNPNREDVGPAKMGIKGGRFGKAVERKAQGPTSRPERGTKRKRDAKGRREAQAPDTKQIPVKEKPAAAPAMEEEKNKIAKRNRIIARKRQARQVRKGR